MATESQTHSNDLQKAQKKRKSSKEQWREDLAGYLFIGPLLIGLFILTLFPIIASFLLSFTNWNFVAGFSKMKFLGFDNFIKLAHDSIFLLSIKNNLILLFVVPITLILSLVLAVVIDKKIYFKDIFKLVYFIPYISSIVAVAIVFQVLFHPSFGPINQMLMSFGVTNPPKWMADPDVALYCVMGLMVWVNIGYNMIVFMAGLQSIPNDLYEAADIDGASKIKQFFNITVPLLSPTTFFLLVTGIIGSFKVFDVIAVLTGGGPANSTTVVVYRLYETAFINLQSGYASAMAIVLLIFVLIITLIQWYGQRKWVNY
ncbi:MULTISPECIES: carbohydrate ABC transporter permease [Paenibacillus]|jgi:multiple sugar transport system permease protein|uniref:Sugar ABC transporter permease n=1 Tax=Paenibacillus baimaensis TaxID=2982185 RepID=A0ABT2UN72_9BACL|nr:MULTISPECIES: sugar ABC transporter permease [unclassified Paenibacillus]MCU6795099.1 sugar ABC transporter permease [Paenibacillus sp. WQ 127069]OMF09023.1 sugar ABC transporter permease [Paenibacillus sp. FSL H7-0331]